MCSAWSGQADFLDPNFSLLLGGEVKPIDKSAVVNNVLVSGSSWFQADDGEVGRGYKDIVKNYKKHLNNAKRLGHRNRTEFSYEKMVEKLDQYFTQYLPNISKQVDIQIPKLDLPKLKKV
jgi:hypothetical protein